MNTTASRFLLVLAILNFPTANAQTIPTLAALKAQAADAVAKVEAEDLWVGGTVVTVSGSNSDVSYYGTRSLTDSATPTQDSQFEIGSVSKSFTGILAAEMVINHPGITLDDPVSKFVPELAGTFAGAATLRQLGTHKSGLPRMPCLDTDVSFCFHPADWSNPYADYTETQFLEYLKYYTRGDAGPYAYVYSNTGAALLGYVVTRVEQKTYDQLLSEEITGPLQMPHTLVERATLNGFPNLIPGYDVALLPVSHWTQDIFAPTGGIVSTGPDMQKYLAANINPPTSVLGQAILLSQKTGICWDSDSVPVGTGIIWKDGGTYSFSSILAFNPIQKIGVFISTNVDSPVTDNLGFYLMGANPLSNNFAGVQLSSSVLTSMTGNYVNPTDSTDTVSILKPKDYLTLEGGSELWRLQATSPLDFDNYDGQHKIGTQKVTFQKDMNGKITGLVVHYTPPHGGTLIDLNYVKQ
jgi:D-alanyl-D-alanine-carboxypeptidase/D-alanyl-D-alanine-endopeptidase